MAVKTVPTRLSTYGIGGLGDRLLPFNVTRPPPPQLAQLSRETLGYSEGSHSMDGYQIL